MRLITQADVDILHTISLAMRLRARDRVAATLRQQYRKEDADADACFAYAISSLIAVKQAGNDLDLYTHFTHALEALGKVLAIEPDHWLARYQRARLPVMIPADYGSFSEYLSDELQQAVADLRWLIDRQRGAPPQPYFACPYLLLAQYHLGRHEVGQALALITPPEVPLAPVPFASLTPILCEPFVLCYSMLSSMGYPAEAASLRAMMQTLFPAEPAVAAVVARHA